MKTKIIVLTILCFGLLNCEISTQKAHADFGSTNNGVHFKERDQIIDGMNYHVWYVDNGTTQTGYSLFVVNTTKDALECELLRKQIKNTK